MKKGKTDINAELEAKRKLVDEKTELIYKELREANFAGAVVNAVSDSYKSKFQQLQEALSDINTISKNHKKTVKYFDEFLRKKKPEINELKLTEEKFLFPGGDEANIRRVQLKGLNYADCCFTQKSVVSDTIKNIGDLIEVVKSDSAFKSAVIVKTKVSYDVAVKALSNIGDDVNEKQNSNTIAHELCEKGRVDCDYDLAVEMKRALKAVGIDCVIVNRDVEMILDKQKAEREKNVSSIIDAHYADLKRIEDRIRKKDYPHKVIWITFAIFCVLLGIICPMVRMFTDNVGLVASSGILPFVYVVTFYMIVLSINKKIEKTNQQNADIRNEIVKYIEEQKKPHIIEEFYKLFDSTEMCDQIDEKIISKLYDVASDLIKRGEKVRAAMFEFLSKVNKESDEIDYLPSGMNRDHLSKIIEFMESGAADNYQEAAYQAVQYELTNACNKAQIAIMEAAEEQRKTEARAQREMQEYYERQRLNEARQAAARQAESARRAEQYAKEQAESAKRAEEAQRDAAKYAEKQTEIAEELLRRAKYGG